jgi:hypothetical protein
LDAARFLNSLGLATQPPVPTGGRQDAAAQGAIGSSVPRPPIQPAERISGKTLSYDQLVDILLMSPPGETQRALARRVGYSESWLSRIIASDAFQARLAERIEKDIEPERREAFRLRFASIEEEARGILLGSLQKLAQRLEDPAGVPDQLVVKSVEVTSRLLGYGARQDPAPPRVEMHVHLEQLANNLRNLNGAPKAIEGTCEEVTPPSSAAAVRHSNAISGDSK